MVNTVGHSSEPIPPKKCWGKDKDMKNKNSSGLPTVEDFPPMPEGVKPPRGGSGVKERISYRDKAKMINALGRVLHADNIIFGVNGTGFNTKIKNKIEKILEDI